MAVKRFYAAEMHSALNQIRNQLGEDAVILGTRKLADGVEVSAAAADAGVTLSSSLRGEKPAVSATTEGEQETASSSEWFMNSINGFEAEHSALHSELGSICSLLQHWMDNQGWDNYATRSPVHAKLWERFRNLGLESELINRLLKTVSSDHDLRTAWQITLTQLSRSIPVLQEDLLKSGGVFAFLGATGVGKTTTIGKLAARYVLEHGAESVALVTTDRYRIAAHEQLRTFGKILGISVQAVDDDHSLESILDSLRSKSLVLVDTAGISPSHKNFDEQFALLSSVGNRINPVMVFAATSQTRVQRAELEAYRELHPRAAIITKTDEAARLGESLDLLINTGVPVAYVTHGQSIPDDIAVANAQQLVNSAVLVSRHKPINREEMVAGFSNAFTNTGYKETRAASVN